MVVAGGVRGKWGRLYGLVGMESCGVLIGRGRKGRDREGRSEGEVEEGKGEMGRQV